MRFIVVAVISFAKHFRIMLFDPFDTGGTALTQFQCLNWKLKSFLTCLMSSLLMNSLTIFVFTFCILAIRWIEQHITFVSISYIDKKWVQSFIAVLKADLTLSPYTYIYIYIYIMYIYNMYIIYKYIIYIYIYIYWAKVYLDLYRKFPWL